MKTKNNTTQSSYNLKPTSLVSKHSAERTRNSRRQPARLALLATLMLITTISFMSPPGAAAGLIPWENNDLTKMSGDGVSPKAGSPLDGYWGSDSSQHVNFIGADGHVHELYIAPGVANWENNDLTKMSGDGVSPKAGSPLDGYWGSDSSQHVNFIGTDGHVHELYIAPGVANWENNDLTKMSGDGVSPKAGSPLDGYWGSDSSQHVNFIGADGHVHELYIAPGVANWENNDLTKMSGDGVSPKAGSPLDGYWGSDSSQHVNFIGADGHVHELYIAPGVANWENNDLTKMSGDGVSPKAGSPLDGYWGSDSSQHVNFIGTDGHVHELYIAPGVANWENNDLTKMSGDGVSPKAGSPLDGYWGSDSSQHVNFIGADGHVHELYIAPGVANWENNDLTKMSGDGVSPKAGSPLDGYWGSDSSQHVNFIGADEHVHELYIAPLPQNIGVEMQYQESTEWCWIAVASSVNLFYNAASTLTQCSLMTTIGQTINGFPPNTSACPSAEAVAEVPGLAAILASPYGTDALYVLEDDNAILGIPTEYFKSGGEGDALNVKGNLSSSTAGFIPLAQIQSEISAGRPVVVDIAWDSNGGQHDVAIAGVLGDKLLILDPIYGESIIPYESFPSTYQGGATVNSVFLTKNGS